MSKDKRSKNYIDGVESFIAFVVKNCIGKKSIKCPCLQCGDMMFHTPEKIRDHLFFYGIDQSYYTWYWHGEVALSGPSIAREKSYKRVQFIDMDNTIEMVQDAKNDYRDDPKMFERILEDVEKPLLLGYTNFTKLFAPVKLFNLKARYGWSNKSFLELLKMVEDVLPLNNELP